MFSKLIRLTAVAAMITAFFGMNSTGSAAGTITRVSVDSSGVQAAGGSYPGEISGNGRYVVFGSNAANLVPNDTNNHEDVFLRDLQAGTTTRVSLATLTGEQANNGSGGPAISDDGRYVTFESDATNLVTGDVNELTDVYVRDLQTGVTKLASVATDGTQANALSERISISGDGRYVLFHSEATNLVANDTNGATDIFVHDMQTGTTVLATVDSAGVQANTSSYGGRISASGRYVVFASGASNLVPNDTNGRTDIFVHDMQTGQTVRASVTVTGAEAEKSSADPSISGDGRYVSFSSYSEVLFGGDTLSFEYLYVKDMVTGALTVASFDYKYGYPMYGLAENSVISDNGRYVAYLYDDKGDGMPRRWLYVHDLVTKQTVTVAAGEPNPGRPSLSADGQRTVFASSDDRLVAGDTNGDTDVFLMNMVYPPDVVPAVTAIFNGCSYGCSGPADPVVKFNVNFTESVTGVDGGDFVLHVEGAITGASITGVSGHGNEYLVSVNTGAGDGTLRLDLVDDDSIKDSTLNPLGGPGTGNGSFSGEVYTVHKSIPTVVSIVRADPNPTKAANVRFTVTFSENVTGLDLSDFVLTNTGDLASTFINEVTGADAIYTVTVGTGTGDGSLRLDFVDDDSVIDVASNPVGGAGAGNGNFTGEEYLINRSSPIVLSVTRLDPEPTVLDSVRFNVTFSKAVTGVDAADFTPIMSGGVTGASVTGVTGVDATYVVTVSTGTGDGTLRLDVTDNDSILDSASHPLGGAGVGNGNFITGEAYTIKKLTTQFLVQTFRSNGLNDGWVLESGENTNVGGSKNSRSNSLFVGDEASNAQYRSILHFPTNYLPDDAIVTEVILMLKAQEIVGTNPFTTHQNINVDVRSGAFGYVGPFSYTGLQVEDFQSPAGMVSVGTIQNNPVGGWYWVTLNNTAFSHINLVGATQMRLAFQLDDNNDLGADYISFYSGNVESQSDRPHLQVEYYVPR